LHAPQLASACGGGIAAFQPTNHEPDIAPLLIDLGVTVYLPSPAPGAQLDWVVAQPADLTGVRQGIPVPHGPAVASGGEIAQLGIGAILVPALAVDPVTGARLGYGAGYYDRLLPTLPPDVLVIGVCREVDVVPVRQESHDVAMAAVLTEIGLRRIGSGGAVTATAPTA
jgi:5-formyltetrahydrofolate cyclo-ligase